jgi:hypothetical protein
VLDGSRELHAGLSAALERVDASPERDALLARLRAPDGAAPAAAGPIADLIGAMARRLAPDDAPPATGAAAAAWRALVLAADGLHGAGVRGVGRLPFLSDALLALLAAEAEARRPAAAAGRATAGAGEGLARLAASRQLREAVSSALGTPAAATLGALYEYDGPGARVRTHVDGDGWEVVFHLLLAQPGPDGAGASELVAHVPSGVERLRVAVGEGVVLRGRGTLHSWAPLGAGERRTLVAVGFRSAD